MRAWIGLGANLGDPATTFVRALDRLGAHIDVDIRRVSSIWRSAPLDAPGPEFQNAVAETRARCTARALLTALLQVEASLGRTRPFHHAPRTIDLDFLLAVDDDGAPIVINSASLQLPHPRLHERAFVLAPLAELGPALLIPGRGRVDALLAACAGQRVERIGPLPYPCPDPG